MHRPVGSLRADPQLPRGVSKRDILVDRAAYELKGEFSVLEVARIVITPGGWLSAFPGNGVEASRP